MTRGPEGAGSPAPRRKRLVTAGHVAAAAVVVLGVVAQTARPLAPDLGPPPHPSAWFTEAYLEHAAAYRDPILVAKLFILGLGLAVPCVAAFTGVGRRLCGRIVNRVGSRRPALGAGVVALTVTIATHLMVLPFAFWVGFLHEGRFGFRTQGLAGWSYDWLVTHAPVWLLVVVVFITGFHLVGRLPHGWPPLVALAAGGLVTVLAALSPLLFEPLLYRMKPLPEGSTRDAVEAVLERADENIDRVLVADASRRTTKVNAYVSGLGASRRVVLYDTLVANHPPAGVGLVLAHELGHHRHRDLVRGTAAAAAGTVAGVYVVAGLLRWRSRRGLQTGQADPRAAAFVLAIAVLLATVSLPVQTLMSRRAEAAADFAALRLTDDPDTYLAKTESLARENLAHPLPPLWARALWGTHPPTVSRLEMGARWPLDEPR